MNMASEIIEILYAFGLQLDSFTSAGILLKRSRRKVRSEVRQCRIQNTDSDVKGLIVHAHAALCKRAACKGQTSLPNVLQTFQALKQKQQDAIENRV